MSAFLPIDTGALFRYTIKRWLSRPMVSTNTEYEAAFGVQSVLKSDSLGEISGLIICTQPSQCATLPSVTTHLLPSRNVGLVIMHLHTI